MENSTEKGILGLGYSLDTEFTEDFRSQMLDANSTMLDLHGCHSVQRLEAGERVGNPSRTILPSLR